MRCDFCYNLEIVYSKGKYSFLDFEEFLKSRKNLLSGIVLCGGEPTFHSEIYDVAKALKHLGFKIKLDTNGLKPDIVKRLQEEKLIDYLALDFKAPEYKFEQITKSKKSLYHNFIQTLKYLIKSDMDFEVRTTFHSELLTLHDIENMLELLEKLNYTKEYFLQSFVNDLETIGNIKASKKIDIKNSVSKKYSFFIKYRNFD